MIIPLEGDVGIVAQRSALEVNRSPVAVTVRAAVGREARRAKAKQRIVRAACVVITNDLRRARPVPLKFNRGIHGRTVNVGAGREVQVCRTRGVLKRATLRRGVGPVEREIDLIAIKARRSANRIISAAKLADRNT